ncbi:hypothetical protein [Herbaspirillum huttiense]|uniref:hypothetical protein n=1 Tax=Herbaspirillum huttiense TaxID=863372 RepID=UPI000686EC0E|nr:hypothetical protein [Herbaspirillum huttiense]
MQFFGSIENIKSKTGKTVTIEGVFVMERGVGYFVQSRDRIAQKTGAILLEYPGLEKRLLSTVPAYGGGPYSYCHDAIISGILKANIGLEFPMAIDEIHNF